MRSLNQINWILSSSFTLDVSAPHHTVSLRLSQVTLKETPFAHLNLPLHSFGHFLEPMTTVEGLNVDRSI